MYGKNSTPEGHGKGRNLQDEGGRGGTERILFFVWASVVTLEIAALTMLLQWPITRRLQAFA